MKFFVRFALTVLLLCAVAIGIAGAGLISIAADEPHLPIFTQSIEWIRERAISRAIREVVLPGNLSDAERVRRGSGNYDAMCVQCHLAPGIEESELRKGLYPAPPSLVVANSLEDQARIDARRFWVTKHGIKGSAMPAWSRSGLSDEAIWDMVAFLRILPSLTPESYRTQVSASDGHSHEGAEPAHHVAPVAPPHMQKGKANHVHGPHDHH